MDSAGTTALNTYVYRAYGALQSSTGVTVNTFRWVGELGYYYDVDRLSHYVRARTYNPRLARWLSRDRLEATADNVNVYQYGGGNPLKLVDPSGLLEVDLTIQPGTSSSMGWRRANLRGAFGNTDATDRAVSYRIVQCECSNLYKVQIDIRARFVILIDVNKINSIIRSREGGQVGPEFVRVYRNLSISNVYGHEQRHVESWIAFLTELAVDYAARETFDCQLSHRQAQARGEIYSTDIRNKMDRFHAREAAHTNPLSPRAATFATGYDVTPPIGTMPATPIPRGRRR
jgi:RHS repeat-associated protein